MTAEALLSSSYWDGVSSLLQRNGSNPEKNGRIRNILHSLGGIREVRHFEMTVPTPDGAYPVKFKLIVGRNPQRSRLHVDIGMVNEAQRRVTLTLFANGGYKLNGDISSLGDMPHRLFSMVMGRALGL